MSIINTEVKLTTEKLTVLSDKIIQSFKEEVNMKNITDVVVDCMGLVGQFKTMSGEDKKKLVIDMIIFIIKNTDSGPFETFEPFIINILPNIIDHLINVEKGKLVFNHRVKNMTSCLNCVNFFTQ